MNLSAFELHWLEPLFLGLLIVPAIVLALCFVAKSFTPHTTPLRPALHARLLRGQHPPYWRRHLNLIIVWTILTLALAGPYLSDQKSQTSQRASANIVVILDISPSMGAEDIKPNRLHHARLQLNSFIRELKSVRLALVSFSANAYIVLPLTHDQETLIHFIDIMAPELVTVPGSNLARALDLAKEVLNEPSLGNAEPTPGLALLISDGEIHDPAAWQSATQFANDGHQLITLGVGSLAGGPVPLPNGQLVRDQGNIITSQLRPEILKSLAQAGQGQYFPLSPPSLRALKQRIDDQQKSEYQEQHQANLSIPLFPYMAGFGLVILLISAYRRPEALLLIVILPGFYSPTLDAAPWDEALAFQALKQGDYHLALNRYQHVDGYAGLIGTGAAAYRLKQWPVAEEAFRQAVSVASSDVERSSAYYNLGNSLAQQNNLAAAQQAFEYSLSLMPSHIGASHNLSLIKNQQTGLSGDNNNPDSANRLKTGQQDAALNPLEYDNTSTAQQSNQTNTNPTRDSETQEALTRWNNKPGVSSSELSSRQQLQMIPDDSAAMLRQRFGIEDVNTTGIVEEKPW